MGAPDLMLAGTRERGEIDLFRSSGGGHEAVLEEHLDPARGVSLNAQCFVVDDPVAIRLAGLENGKDDAQHLARQRDDGLVVSLADTQRGKLVLQSAGTSAGGLGELAQQPAHPCVALARLAALALSRTLVVARAYPHPEGQSLGRAEVVHFRTDLHQQHRRAHAVGAGNRLQQHELGCPGMEPLDQSLLEACDACL